MGDLRTDNEGVCRRSPIPCREQGRQEGADKVAADVQVVRRRCRIEGSRLGIPRSSQQYWVDEVRKILHDYLNYSSRLRMRAKESVSQLEMEVEAIRGRDLRTTEKVEKAQRCRCAEDLAARKH